jgi:hypothetical protein
MNLQRIVRAAADCARGFSRHPGRSVRLLHKLPIALRGFLYSQEWPRRSAARPSAPDERAAARTESANPLMAYFDAHAEGRGIWKWRHYFDISHRH